MDIYFFKSQKDDKGPDIPVNNHPDPEVNKLIANDYLYL